MDFNQLLAELDEAEILVRKGNATLESKLWPIDFVDEYVEKARIKLKGIMESEKAIKEQGVSLPEELSSRYDAVFDEWYSLYQNLSKAYENRRKRIKTVAKPLLAVTTGLAAGIAAFAAFNSNTSSTETGAEKDSDKNSNMNRNRRIMRDLELRDKASAQAQEKESNLEIDGWYSDDEEFDPDDYDSLHRRYQELTMENYYNNVPLNKRDPELIRLEKFINENHWENQ